MIIKFGAVVEKCSVFSLFEKKSGPKSVSLKTQHGTLAAVSAGQRRLQGGPAARAVGFAGPDSFGHHCHWPPVPRGLQLGSR